ncbi:hypothetical protein Nmel_008990 [Mimus melanotis]
MAPLACREAGPVPHGCRRPCAPFGCTALRKWDQGLPQKLCRVWLHLRETPHGRRAQGHTHLLAAFVTEAKCDRPARGHL